MGDALTTAFRARSSNSSDLSTSWRGLSWSIGGDGILDTHTTLPNILKKFNPHILGFSTGTLEETAGLNVAMEGARARDMPAQARDLVERMKNHPEIDLESDWKLITLFIGSNDMCHYCENPNTSPSCKVRFVLLKASFCGKDLKTTTRINSGHVLGTQAKSASSREMGQRRRLLNQVKRIEVRGR